MKDKVLLLLIFLMAIAVPANAQTTSQTAPQEATRTTPQHSVGASWSYFGFNSTYSKNSEKKTFGTLGLRYECRFNKWIGVSGRFAWSHSWFGHDANPAYSYPKKDNAILILPGCNVTWFRNGILELHSEIAAGLDIRVQKNDRGTFTTWGFAGQFDAIGVKFNWDHAYIDLSAGWGSIGCISLGAGYKF